MSQKIVKGSGTMMSYYISIVLGQLGERAKYFKSLGNPKSIVWEITKLHTHLQEILREQNRDFQR